MSLDSQNDPLFDIYIFETTEQLEQLEQIIISCEEQAGFSQEMIGEIFRIMHTLKGSSALMAYESISSLAHSIEDLFHFMRDKYDEPIDYREIISIVLGAIDFVKKELLKIQTGEPNTYEHISIISNAKRYLHKIQDEVFDDTKVIENTKSKENPIIADKRYKYKLNFTFSEDCPMVNLKAFEVVHKLEEYVDIISHTPSELFGTLDCCEIIMKNGLEIIITSDTAFEITTFANKIALVESFQCHELISNEKKELKQDLQDVLVKNSKTASPQSSSSGISSLKQTLINVHVEKLDKLLDLVGELVISESLVVRNRDNEELFEKAVSQQRKITNELQEIVMSVRMLPITKTFHHMNRIVRDMSHKLEKKINLEIIGNDVEVDKNIIDHISDPLVHIIRNAADHGIEQAGERLCKNKPSEGKITLEAKSSGSDVWVIIKDDGRGLNKDVILQKARENGLLIKPESEYSEKEIFNMVFAPGFTTKTNVSEFSGRGVGLDIVTKSIEKLGGTIIVESTVDIGTQISIRIPLTLSIIEGMIVKVGKSTFSIPDTAVQECFRSIGYEMFEDLNQNEMIMIRGQCYPIIRLEKRYKVKNARSKIEDGILIMVKNEDKGLCLFADTLLGVQQVVVKALPAYVKRTTEIDGCALLGDGSISLILNVASIIENCVF